MPTSELDHAELDMKGKYPIGLQSSAQAIVSAIARGGINREQEKLAVEVISDLMRQNKTLRQHAGRSLNAELEAAKKRVDELENRLRDCDSHAKAVVENILNAIGRELAMNFSYKDSIRERRREECAPFIALQVCREAMPVLSAARKRIEEVAGLEDLRRFVMGEEAAEYQPETAEFIQ